MNRASAKDTVAADAQEAGEGIGPLSETLSNLPTRKNALLGKSLITCGLLVTLLLSATGCRERKQSKTDTDVLARVGTAEIRAADLVAEIQRRHRTVRDKADREAILEELITRQAMVARALQLGLDQDPRVKRSYENLLIGEMKKRQLEPGIRSLEVTAADLQSASQRTASLTPELGPMAEFAILSSQSRSRASPQKRAQMVDRLTEARERALQFPATTRDFGELAIDYSDDQASRYRGGQVGWFNHAGGKYRFPTEVLQAGFRLQTPGEISEIIETTNGVFLVRLMARRTAGDPVPTPDESLLRQKIMAEKQTRAEASFIRETRSKVPITLFPENLSQAAVPDHGVAARNGVSELGGL